MNKIRLILRGIDSINEWVGRVAAYILLAMMLIIAYEVIARYVFSAPTKWAFETSQFLLAGLVALSAGYILLHHGHVNVEIVYNLFGIRSRAIIDLITAVLFFAFIIFFLRETGEMALDSVAIREYSESPWGPIIYPVKIVIFVGGLLILIQGIAKFIRDFVTATTGKVEEPKRIGSFDERKG